MKKLLGKRSLLLVAFLVSLCMPAMAQTDISGTALNSSTIYYIRNVATGLYMKYGGSYGTHAVEGDVAHPVKISKVDGAENYSIKSTSGYLGDGAYLDRPEAESKWFIMSVSGASNRYYIVSSGYQMLASCGGVGGQLELVHYNVPNPEVSPSATPDPRLQWEFVTEAQLRVERNASSLTAPVDMTPLIKAASIDFLDGRPNQIASTSDPSYYRDNWQVIDLFTGDRLSYVDTEDAQQDTWSWFDDAPRDENPATYGHSYVSQNDYRGYYSFQQNIGTLPAGTYTLSFEGFAAALHRAFKSQFLGPLGGYKYSQTELNVTASVMSADRTPLSDAVAFGTPANFVANSTYYNFIAEGGTDNNGETKLMYAINQFRDNDNYRKSITFTLDKATEVYIDLTKSSWNEINLDDLTNVQVYIAFDNFSLFYHGKNANNPAHGNMYYDKIVAALNSAEAKLDALPDSVTIDGNKVKIPGCSDTHEAAWESGITSIDIKTKASSEIALLDGADVDSEEEYVEVLHIIEAAYQAALEAHRQAINSLLQEDDEWIDPYIVNPSFELGNLTGWMVQSKSSDVDVFKAEGYKATTGTDGSYLFNAFINDTDTNTPWVKQTVKGLKNGLYKLTAKLTSAAGNKVYLLADSYHSSITATDPGTFQPAELYFLVENGTATGGGTVTIGAVGGNNRARDGEPYEFYYPWGGCWFKADDFHLEYVCQPNLGRLKLVLDEANEAYEAFDADGKTSFKATKDAKESIYNNAKTSKTDLASDVVNGHINDIYTALTTAAKVQLSKGADMTYAIANHNFELGALLGSPATYPGWSCSTTGDQTKAAIQEDYNYTVVGADGRYLFNTWNNGTAEPLTQTIGGLPNGSYMVSAVLATDKDQKVILTAGEKTITKTSQIAKNNGELIEYDDEAYTESYCEVTDGNLTIEIKGENNVWFKADNFRLTLVKPAVLDLYDEKGEEQFQLTRFYDPFIWINVHRTIKAGSWSTLVLPFNMPIPEGWEVKKLSTTNRPVHNDGNITLRFDAVESIEAGVPYMVRVSEQCTTIMASQASLNTLLQEPSESTSCGTYKVTFVGSYAPDNLPVTVEGKEEIFFVSGNKFYRSTGPNNYMKAFRAYFKIEPNSANAPALRSLSMRIGDETIIESVEDEVTVVGIYNANGVKLESMQPGINILRMNNGTTKKVIIK